MRSQRRPGNTVPSGKEKNGGKERGERKGTGYFLLRSLSPIDSLFDCASFMLACQAVWAIEANQYLPTSQDFPRCLGSNTAMPPSSSPAVRPGHFDVVCGTITLPTDHPEPRTLSVKYSCHTVKYTCTTMNRIRPGSPRGYRRPRPGYLSARSQESPGFAVRIETASPERERARRGQRKTMQRARRAYCRWKLRSLGALPIEDSARLSRIVPAERLDLCPKGSADQSVQEH